MPLTQSLEELQQKFCWDGHPEHICISSSLYVTKDVSCARGGKSPCNFEIGQAVFLQGLCPTASNKWRPATISCKFGPLTYEVTIDGHTRQPHIDHLIPHPVVAQSTPTESNGDDYPLNDQLTMESLSDQVMDVSFPNPFVLIDNEDIDPELEKENTEPVAAPIQRIQCNHKPPKRLIEEIP